MSQEQDPKKTQESIPASKVARATRFVQTGVKVGTNYVKHYARQLLEGEQGRERLDEENARDIYEALSELKGSALKVAQMMSMDRNLLPQAYSQRFQMAQYSAPPLSYPLVVRTFRKYFQAAPTDLFDEFDTQASNAASIGQVHRARKQGKDLAVKVQYPGVADSVSADLKLVKPFAVNLLGLNERDVEHYMQEVEQMLLSETDYLLELERSQKISKACAHLPDLFFPHYYPELSAPRILTMDWLEGQHLEEFLQTEPSQEVRDRIGQALWDFYDFQIHQLREVHADPHPGNFLLQPDGRLGIIDFGCVKVLPEDFYAQYFALMDCDLPQDAAKRQQLFEQLRFIYPDDSPQDREQLDAVFSTMIGLLGRPFHQGSFDFGDKAYFQEIFEFGEASAKVGALRNSKKPRGLRHGLYLNRTYFGLYAILHQLQARIRTQSGWFDNQKA